MTILLTVLMLLYLSTRLGFSFFSRNIKKNEGAQVHFHSALNFFFYLQDSFL